MIITVQTFFKLVLIILIKCTIYTTEILIFRSNFFCWHYVWFIISILKETPLVRCFVFLCKSVEEWRLPNEWKVRTTHTSETSVSRARPQVFFSTLQHIRSRIQNISRVGVLYVNPLGLIALSQRDQKLMGTERHKQIDVNLKLIMSSTYYNFLTINQS